MNNQQNAGRDRALYEKVKKMAPQGVTPMMATLREQIVLANNNTTYKFTFNEQRGGSRRTDILLSIKDSFYANGLSLGILVERKNRPGSGVITYYPDPFLNGNTGADAADLECVYNGQLKAQIDRDVLLDKFSTRRFRRVPQRVSGQASQNSGGATQYYGVPGEQHTSDGVVYLEPNLVLRGTKSNEFTVTLPQFDVTPSLVSSDPAYEISLVMEVHGFLIPGGAGLAN